MVAIFFKRYKSMIRISIFFFCVGCGIALCFIRIDCAHAVGTRPQSPSVLHTNVAGNGVEYAVLVLTSPSNEARRNVIRSTWASFVSNIFIENGERLYKWNHTWTEKQTSKHNFIKVYFAIGTKDLDPVKLDDLKTEHGRRKDMIFLDDLIDKYENLALKLKLSFKWFSENLTELKYLIKCDDDSFVRVDLIVKDLEAYAPQMDSHVISTYVAKKMKSATLIHQGLYWGYFDGRARVQLGGKYQEQEWFLCDNYLPYALGGGYVVSRNIVDFVSKNSDLLSSYRSEDVSLAVWTAPLDGINRVHDIRFDTAWVSRGCLNHMLVRHKQTTQDMFKMYRTLVESKGQTLCRTESLRKGSYEYNWRAPPSQCCKTLHPLIDENSAMNLANAKYRV